MLLLPLYSGSHETSYWMEIALIQQVESDYVPTVLHTNSGLKINPALLCLIFIVLSIIKHKVSKHCIKNCHQNSIFFFLLTVCWNNSISDSEHIQRCSLL